MMMPRSEVKFVPGLKKKHRKLDKMGEMVIDSAGQNVYAEYEHNNREVHKRIMLCICKINNKRLF